MRKNWFVKEVYVMQLTWLLCFIEISNMARNVCVHAVISFGISTVYLQLACFKVKSQTSCERTVSQVQLVIRTQNGFVTHALHL